MAIRTWGKLLLTALGVSVLAGAGQLGVAYGFGILRLDGDFTAGSVNRWPAQLVWVGWFAAVAAVAGAVLTERLAHRVGFPGSSGEQVAVAGAAALGATVVAPLCMQPARTAELGTVDPVWAVGICAVLGAVVGAGAALAVLLQPPLGWNVALTAGVVWLLALISVVPSLASTGPLRTVRLGVVEPSWLDPATAQRLAPLILPVAALLAGAATGALARWRGHLPLVGGAAGAAGPVLVAFAYLTAGPGDGVDRYQLAPYYGALIAVAAGALGSAAATVVRRRPAAPATGAIEPTDILQPLPVGPAPTAVAATAADVSTHVATTGPTTAAATTWGDGNRGTVGQATTVFGATTGGLSTGGPGRQPAGAGGSAPAHWDWPLTPGGTATPAPQALRPTAPSGGEQTFADDRGDPSDPVGVQQVGAANTSPPPDSVHRTTGRARATSGAGEEPVTSALGTGVPGPVVERDPDDPAQSLPAPTLLSSARRISAVDVLAAGRAASPTTPPTSATGSDPVPAPSEPEGTGIPITGAPTDEPATSAAPATSRAKPPKRARRPRASASGPADPVENVPAPADAPPAAAEPAAPSPRTRRPTRTRRETAQDPRSTSADQPTRSDTAEFPPTDAASRPAAADLPPAEPEPAPRPRFSLFGDDSDRPVDVRPTRITPAPALPRQNTGPTDPGRAETDTPAAPAPRPRHRAPADPERPLRSDAVTNGTPQPATESAAPETEGGTGTRHADDRETTDRVAEGGTSEDADREKSRPRRGLFRRNRAKGGEESVADRDGREPESVPARDAEYVDWVTGLGRPAESESDPSLRTGRHHRD